MSSTNNVKNNSEAPKTGRFSLISTLIISVVVFVVLCIGVELVARSGWAQKTFPLRSIGNYHTQFEIKWFKLEKYVQQNGGVDVLLLGSSMVNTGVDPAIVASEYEAQTGIKLRIFNFGVEGLTVSPNSIIAKILIEKYHPATVLFFADMRDFIAANGLATEARFKSDPWIRYQSGENSFTGWLIDHSAALQIALPYVNWSRASFPDDILLTLRRNKETTPGGYEAERGVGSNVEAHPNPSDLDQKAIFDLYSNFKMDPARVKDFENILLSPQPNILVLVSETPVYPTYYDYFGGEQIYQAYKTDLLKVIKSANVRYFPSMNFDLIPQDGWADNHHLNFNGAPVYSKYLGGQLAELCLVEKVCPSTFPAIGGTK